MPTDGKSSRRRNRPRTRAKIRDLWQVRSKMVNLEGESRANPATESHPGHSMASGPQSSGQASVRGVRDETLLSTVKVWVSQRFKLLLLGFWFLLMLCFYMNSGLLDSVSASNYILWSSENADGPPFLNESSVSGSLIRFFFPTTCIPVEGQVLKPCKQGPDLKKDECLKYKCCYSSLKTTTINCFAPLIDKPTQMFRMFGFGAMSMIFLGCLPIYCCSLCWRSKWAWFLRRRFNRTLKRVKKHRKKPKRDTEVLETAVDEEGYGDEKDQETTALFSH